MSASLSHDDLLKRFKRRNQGVSVVTQPVYAYGEMALLDANMPTILSRAIKQTKSSATRDHIKADRNERVSLFVTDLRREICSASTPLDVRHQFGAPRLHNKVIDIFCRKSVWHDVGVLLPNRVTTGIGSKSMISGLTEESVRDWLSQVVIFEPSMNEVILEEMNELDRSMLKFNQQIDQVTRLNTEADEVFNSLVNLIESAT